MVRHPKLLVPCIYPHSRHMKLQTTLGLRTTIIHANSCMHVNRRHGVDMELVYMKVSRFAARKIIQKGRGSHAGYRPARDLEIGSDDDRRNLRGHVSTMHCTITSVARARVNHALHHHKCCEGTCQPCIAPSQVLRGHVSTMHCTITSVARARVNHALHHHKCWP
jgi:hypothetical protein